MNKKFTFPLRGWFLLVWCLLAFCGSVSAATPPTRTALSKSGPLPTAPTSPTVDGASSETRCSGFTEMGISFTCPTNTTASWQSTCDASTSSDQNGFIVIYNINPGVETYTLTCTDAARQTSTGTYTLTGVDPPEKPTVTTSATDLTVVEGASFSLTASCATGSTPVWLDDETAGAVRELTAPYGSIELTYDVYCEGSCSSDWSSITINVVPPPITPPGSPTITPGTDLSACLGTPVSVTATCPVFYLPQFVVDNNPPLFQSTYTVDGSTAGVYNYTVVCMLAAARQTPGNREPFMSTSATGVITIVNPPSPPVVYGNPASLTATAGTSVTLTAGCEIGTVEWRDQTGAVVISPSAIGVYSYTANCVAGPGCRSTDVPVSVTILAPTSQFPAVDIALPKVDVSRRTPAPGERVRYVTHILNEDVNTATNIRIAVQMPAGFGYSTDNSPTSDPTSTTWAITPTSAGTTYDVGANRVYHTVPSLAPGQRLLLYFYGTVPPTPTTSTASDANKYYAYWEIVSADNTDPDSPHGNGFCNGEDDTQSIDTRVNVPINAGADVELFGNMSVSNTTPAQNEVVTFQIGIRNNLGPQVATNVVTKATLPVGLSFVASSTPGVSYNAGTRELTMTAASIGVNATQTFVFTANVTAPDATQLRLQAEIRSSDQFDHDSVYGNAICNNYDDDTDELRLTVRGALAPPSETPPTTGGTLTLLAPLYDCATGQITFRTNGGDGSPITFRAIGVQRSAPTSTTGVVEAGVRLDAGSSGIITIEASQSGQTAQPLSFNFRQFCAQNPDPVSPPSSTTTTPPTTSPSSLTLLAPLYNCATRQVTFQTAGGSGSPILYSIVFVTLPSSNNVQTIDAAVVNDQNNSTVILRVQQDGVVLNRSFDFRAFCSGTPPTNQPPVAPFIANQSATINTAFTFTAPMFTDPNGDMLTYSATGLPAKGLTFNAGTRQISGVPSQTGTVNVTITAKDPGNLSASVSFAIVITDPSSPPVTPNTLALVAPTYNCSTGAFTFNTTGGSGQPIEYRAVGITDWTTTAGPYTVRPFSDAQPFALQARYVGQPGSEVSYSWDFKTACNGIDRLARETASDLEVTVLGNPTATESVQVMVRGAAGQPLKLRLSDASGQPVNEQSVESAEAVESRRIQLGRSAGVYLLQVNTPTQRTTVKIVRQ